MDKKAAKKLLIGGVLAGPVYLAVSILQILTRGGFDITRHSWSLLSNGDLGWIQISNFLITGVLTIAGALGLSKILKGEKAGKWGPILLGLYGLGLISAGIFKADPVDGFPPGTPLGFPTSVSTSGILHLLSAMIGFSGFIVACFVFARRFRYLKQKDWTNFSLIAGILFLVGFLSLIILPGFGLTTLGVFSFIFGMIVGWSWLSLLSWKFLKNKL